MLRLILLLMAVALAVAYRNPHYAAGRSTMVHLFEWKWVDIAAECERFLGFNGFGGVLISPPNENLVIRSRNRPWFERYEAISYRLITRSGNEDQFTSMVRRCNNVGVRIYVDTVINHMTQTWGPTETFGTGGGTVHENTWLYPSVPYRREHFNFPCVIQPSDYDCCPERVRTCQLNNKRDLNQSSAHVRFEIVGYMNRLINLGVAGFRIYSAKHMWPHDLRYIYDNLHDLNTEYGFPAGARPYIYQEVIDNGNEAVSRNEYTPLAPVAEFTFGMELSRAFLGRTQLRWLRNWGPQWNLLPSDIAHVFIDNHENQRGYGTGGDILTYKQARQYRAATAFMLAHPYGQVQVMSSYAFNDTEAGPPQNSNNYIISPSINPDNSCGNGWVCEHRWPQIFPMVAFRNVAANQGVDNWWDNGSNQIAFSRGHFAFIAFNNDGWNLNQTLQTGLFPGRYCDVISGSRSGNSCTGKTIIVGNDGRAHISIADDELDMMLAIHRGPQSIH
ncbi:alpha-amylase 1-like [Hyposmocoma kahamanoa]|uniref:alpha-amylase 1-like n=1 Tax=Hyposmocoma kahamanoa TaxID=1477025 RepID=UPI000E6D66CC|nr:alpha-amylase 1-like [Hyposmocoma kahamanoa]